MEKIEFLNQSEFKVLKVIQVEQINKFHYFSGYAYYLRTLTEAYNEKTNDYIDDLILKGIKISFPDSKCILSKNILFKGQLDEILLRFAGKKDIDFSITFLPNIPLEKYKEVYRKDIFICTKQLFFNYNSASNNDIKLYVNTNVQADIEYDKLTDFSDDIESITFLK